MNIQPFTIAIPQAALDDLRERLAHTRWPDEIEEAGWDYGTDLTYLKELVDYWQLFLRPPGAGRRREKKDS